LLLLAHTDTWFASAVKPEVEPLYIG